MNGHCDVSDTPWPGRQSEADQAAGYGSFASGTQDFAIPGDVSSVDLLVDLQVLHAELSFGAQVFAEVIPLMTMMEELNSLLESDGDEQANDNGGDVDEEVAPGVNRMMGWMDVEHGM